MKIWTSLIVIAVAASACRSASAPEPHAASPVSVTTAVAAMRHVPRTFEAGGTVRARTTATVASRITAPVLTVHVTAGDRVRGGQPLVTLDARDLDANRARAASEAAALERAHAAAMADRAAAEAALTLARASHARIAALRAHDAATAQELDEAVSALRVAEARLGATDAQEGASTASLDAAHQAEAAASATASYAVLTAPFDGLVTERLIDPGTLATPGAPLLRIDDTRGFRLEVLVDESRLASIAEGAAVDVAFDADADEGTTVNGRVAEVSRAIDAGSHSFVVKIDLPSDASVRSGMFGRARFAAQAEDLLTVPLAAIVQQGQLSTLFVAASDQRAQLRVIDTGARTQEWVEVLAGLAPGEQVIVSPAGVRDGVVVRVLGKDTRR